MTANQKTTLADLVTQREDLRTALTALLATCARHRWHVNSDERDTIALARSVLLNTPWKPLKGPNTN